MFKYSLTPFPHFLYTLSGKWYHHPHRYQSQKSEHHPVSLFYLTSHIQLDLKEHWLMFLQESFRSILLLFLIIGDLVWVLIFSLLMFFNSPLNRWMTPFLSTLLKTHPVFILPSGLSFWKIQTCLKHNTTWRPLPMMATVKAKSAARHSSFQAPSWSEHFLHSWLHSSSLPHQVPYSSALRSKHTLPSDLSMCFLLLFLLCIYTVDYNSLNHSGGGCWSSSG